MEERRLDISIRDWLENYKKNSVKVATYDRLLIAYKLMANYPIAGFRVPNIDCGVVQRYINTLVEDGYSMSTIKKQYNLISAYWKFAMANGLVEKPVYLGVQLPAEETLKKPRKEIEVYPEFEQRVLMRALGTLEKPCYAAAILMLETGLRVGEVLALRWNDVLWSRKALKVNATLVRMSSKPVTYVQNSPKSKKSKRTIPLSALALKTLERLLNLGGSRDGFIFARKDDPSLPISYSSLEFHIRALCEKNDISYRGMHAFRHTFATNCYERGCDVKILSKLLGHADVGITYNTYIHLYGDALEEMRKVIG